MTDSKAYWQSPRELAGDPELAERRRREFWQPLPAVNGESRRDFLKLLGFSLAAAGCTRAPVREAVPLVELPPEATPGEALHYATTCGGCSAGCGLLVKVRDGRPIKIEGNPLSPLSAGGTCAVGQATVLSLYDRGRLAGPRWRGEAVSWQEIDRRVKRRLAAVAARGATIALVTGTVTSPATRRLLERWRERYPTTRVVTYDPVSAAALRRAGGDSFGRPVVPRYRFDRARVVVGLDADFLGTWLSPVEHARAWAAGRRLGGGRRELSWHLQLEARLSLTGANADLRIPVAPSQLGPAALALLGRLAALAGEMDLAPPALPPLPDGVAAAIEAAAGALWRSRGQSLVVAGADDLELQVVVHAINHLLGNVGTTVDLDAPSYQKQGDEAELADLVREMERGEVGALIVYGANPLYDSPLGRRLRQALEQVPLSVSLADRRDETAAHMDAVCPDHHFLEAWNDAEPVAGVVSLTQPTTAPLFDTRAAQESLLAWMGEEPDYLVYLKEHWRREIFPRQGEIADFDRFWWQALHDGVVELPAAQPGPSTVTPFTGDLAGAGERLLARAAAARRQQGYELVAYEKVGMRDGRWANNPWLQELPDPISRVAWGNYAALAPALAERLGLADGDVVLLAPAAGGAAIELPVHVQPGQADGTVAVAVGYGRTRAGKAADGVGANAFPLTGTGEDRHRAVTLTPAGRREKLAATQNHHSLEGRPIVKETTLAAWRQDPAAGNERPHHHASLWPERHEPGHAWGMAIDLNACTGCAACVVACQAENNVAVVGKEEVTRGREMHWIRIDRYYSGPPESPETVFQPMMCQHCDHAPCETVCPVLATVHSSDGLNQQVYNRCVGTRYCANNCPYKVRRFNWFNYAGNDRFDYHLNDELGPLVLNPDVVVRSRGVMEKCSMCIQRVQAGKLAAGREGRRPADGDIETACQEACPTRAITFGDWNDPSSRLARMGEDGRFYQVLEELNVRPSVGYLTQVRNRESPLDPEEV